MAGVSRSATLILCYLLKYTTLSLVDAFTHLQRLRPCIRPNMGFFRALIQYEVQLNQTSSVQMLECREEATGRCATVPHFYPSNFPELFKIELARQNCAHADK